MDINHHPNVESAKKIIVPDPSAQELATLMMGISSLRAAKVSQQENLTHAKQKESLYKNMIGGVVGNVLEWYDFAVFGFFAPVVGDQFFPSDDPLISLLSAFSVFAAAFLVRPIGGIIFGRIGDSLGRKRALQFSVMMMAVPTFLIGLLPTYSQVGGIAPVLLILLRIVQGLSVGGEMIGSMAFVAETAPLKKRGFFSSWTFASCYGGMMLGSLSAVLLNGALGPDAVESWGWRLPFLAGIAIGLAGLWMRRELNETPVFEKMKAAGTVGSRPLAEAVKLVPWRIFHASTLVILVGGGFYLLFVWWPTFLSRSVHPFVPHAMALNTVSLILLIILVPLMGRLSDEWGRKPLLVASSAGLALCSLPLFMLISATDGFILSVLFAQFCFTALMSIYLGTIPSTIVEMFPPRVRYSAIGLSYNISLCIFGGTAPLIATWLVFRYQSVSAPALYLTVLALFNLLAALNLPGGTAIGEKAKKLRLMEEELRSLKGIKARSEL